MKTFLEFEKAVRVYDAIQRARKFTWDAWLNTHNLSPEELHKAAYETHVLLQCAEAELEGKNPVWND